MMNKKNENLCEGPIVSTMVKFTVPFLLANLLQTLYGIIDTMIIGQFGSTEGISAVACSVQLMSIFTFLAIGISGGGTVLVGQCIGAKDDERAARTVGNLIIDFSLISFLLIGLCLFGYKTFLGWLRVPVAALPEAYSYMKICSFGIPLIVGYNIVCALLRATGDSKSPLVFVAIASGVNIAGDLLLTGYFQMGAKGVAIATVAAQGISFMCALVFTMKKGLVFPFSAKDIKFDTATTLEIFKIGVPMGIQSILVNLSFMFITAIINEMGLTASASMGIGDKIVEFAFMPQMAFSASLAVIVAQNYGAGQMDRAWKSVKYALLICVGIETVFMLICMAFPSIFPSLFTDDAEVIVMSGQYMQAYSIDAVLTGITFCLAGFLNGTGRTTFNMIQNLATTFLCRVPATWLLSRLPDTNLFWIGCAAPISTIVSVVLLGVYARKIINKKGEFV